MENFVVALQNNIGKDFEQQNGVRSSRFRDILRFLSNASPEFKIIEFTKEGFVAFETPRKTLNISFERMRDYKKELYSSLIINTMGELVVRENLTEMVQVLLSVAYDDWSEVVNGRIHNNFGMTITKDKFIFKFHISLLQKILTEDV